MLEQGIIILCTGYGLYSKYAYNLLLTIKAIEPETLVALAYDEAGISFLTPEQSDRFDQLIHVDHKSFGGKLALDLITPFKKTIVLDADMAWMPKHPPSTLFANLDGHEFTAITEGRVNLDTGSDEGNGKYFWWADIPEMKEVYKLTTGTLYQFRTEMMYFETTPKVKKLFAKARKIYAQPRLKSIKKFADRVPDELALNIAAALTDVHPHKYKWTPSFWTKLHGEHIRSIDEIYNNYYLLSAGSHTVSNSTRRLYDAIVGSAATKMGGIKWFPLQNKAQAIPDRLKF